jgi:hypothetical protein
MTRWERFLEFFGCKPGAAVGFDGCSAESVCVRCGCPILQDSQGGWFPVGPSLEGAGSLPPSPVPVPDGPGAGAPSEIPPITPEEIREHMKRIARGDFDRTQPRPTQ